MKANFRTAFLDTVPVMTGYLFLGLMNRLAVFLVIVLATMLTRFLPFWIFGENRKTPPGNFLPELLCTALVAALHIWKRNTLLSIAAGTVAYMLLVQLVF